LVLVNHLNDIRVKTTEKSALFPALIKGAGDRFRPILITSFSTVAGLLPLAYGLGGSDPFIAPMALAIGYGLLFSTPLTLFLLPALYLIQLDLMDFYNHYNKMKKKYTQKYFKA
jgi:multidrug efflux pump subunit AcrB